jgi:hypothetical protein
MFQYIVLCNCYSILFVILGIDTSLPCGPLPNVDLVHFSGNNFYRFSYRKYAMALLPSTTLFSPLSRLVCLKYYRDKSDGWRHNGNCDDCVTDHQRILRSLTNCRKPDANDCSCIICTRQPPSLLI